MIKLKRTLFFLLAAVLSLTQMKAQTVLEIGDGTVTQSATPVSHNYNYSYSQAIYTSDEFEISGSISAVAYSYDYYANETITSTIYMGVVSRNSFDEAYSFVPLDSLTQVYSGNLTFSHGWTTITLDTPFEYNGEGNLVIAYLNTTGSSTAHRKYLSTSSVDVKTIYVRRDNPIIDPTTLTENDITPSWERPNIRLTITPPAGFCYPVYNITASNITSDGADISWECDGNVPNFAIEYKRSTDENWMLASNSISDNTYTLTGLETYSAYDVKVYGVCPDGNSIARGISFMTAPDNSLILSLPYEQRFDEMTEEELAQWFFQNETNAWHIGTAVNNTYGDNGELTENGGALYISNDNGATNTYSPQESYSYAYAFVNFEPGNNYGVQFDWRCFGEGDYDYAEVYLLPIDATLSSASLPEDTNRISGELSGSSSWQSVNIEIPQAYNGNTWKLVFAWENDDQDCYSPAIAIDNLYIRSLSCSNIDTVVVSLTEETNSLTASFNVYDQNEGAQYLLEYRAAGSNVWNSITSSNPIEVRGLSHSMVYEYRVTAICNGSNNSLVSDVYNFTTPCGIISALPYEQSFDQEFYPADSVIGNSPAPNCWYNINGGNEYYYFYRTTSSPISGTASLRYDGASSSYVAVSDWFISPVFALTGNERLNFKLKTANTSTSLPDIVVKVYALNVSETDISATADTSRFALVQTINHDWSTANAIEYEVSLGAYSAATRFAFVINDPCRPFYLDDIKVSEMPVCPDVYHVSVSAMSSTSASVSFTTLNATDAGWTIAYGTVGQGETFNPETATTITVTEAGQVPVTISGLTTGETYWFAVKHSCEGGAYSAPVSCYIPVVNTLPYEQNFDDASTATEWNFIKRSASSTSDWVIGTAVNNTTDEGGNSTNGGAMYISTDNGATNTYDIENNGNFYALTSVALSGYSAYRLSFNWKAGGEGTGSFATDYMKAYLVPFGVEIPTSTASDNAELDNYAIINESSLSDGQWQSKNILLQGASYNGLYQLVFRWANDDSETEDNTGVAIDNIRLVALECDTVLSVTATVQEDAVTGEYCPISIDIEDNNTSVTYVLQYKISSATEWTEVGDLTEASFPYILSADFGTSYQIRVAAVCSDGERTAFVSAANLATPCAVLTAPWSETFETTPFTTANCWQRKSGLLTANGSIQTSDLSDVYSGWKYDSSRLIDGVAAGRLNLNIYGTGCNHWAITPSIDLGDGSTTYKLAFNLALTKYGNSNPPEETTGDDKFAVLVSADNGQSWNAANAIIFADGDADTQHNFSDLTNSPTRVIFKLVNSDNTPLSGLVKFAFYGESTVSGGDNECFVYNLEVSEWNDCIAPYNVRAENVTDISANLSFNSLDSTAASFEYSLVEGEDTDIETGAIIAVTSGFTVALSELAPATTYKVAVRTICGEGVYSPWSTPAIFTTLIIPETIPYITGFENSDENATWGFMSSSSTNAWAIGTATFAGEENGTSAYISNDNGVSYAATAESQSTKAVMFKDFNFGEDASAVYNLDFDYKILGRASGNNVNCGLSIYVLDPQPISINDLSIEDGEVLLYGENSWTHERLELTGYTGVKRLAFMTWGYTQTSEVNVPAAIDNVSLRVAACVSPQEVAVFNEGATSVEVSWTGTSDSYIISYRALTDTEVIDVPATSSPFTLTGLDMATNYVLTIRGVCGNETSISSETVAFRTYCFDGAIDEFPYEDGFENGIDCWTLLSPNNTHWAVESYGSYPTCTPHGGSKMILYNSNEINDGRWGALISHPMNFTQNMEVSFWIYHHSDYPDREDSVLVYVNGTPDLEQATLVGGVARPNRPNAPSGWTQHTFPLPTGLTGTQYIILKGLSHNGRNIYVDDFKVDYAGATPIEPCDAPTDLTVSNITETSAEISWNGTASSYEVRLNGGSAETVSTTSTTFTDLTAATDYTVEVRAVCGTSQSEWVSTDFTTQSESGEVAPEVTTLAATGITHEAATLNGTITAGSEEITAQGFKYKATTATEWTTVAATGTTLTATVNNLTAETTYEYKAFATTASGTVEGEVMNFTTLSASGLADIENGISAIVYPNPAKDKAMLRLSGLTTTAKVIISDLQGRIILTDEIQAGVETYELNTSSYASGVYYIRIVSGNNVNTQKLIVE